MTFTNLFQKKYAALYKKYILIRSFVFGLDFSFEKVSLVWFYLNLTTPLNCVCVISFMYGSKMTNEG